MPCYGSVGETVSASEVLSGKLGVDVGSSATVDNRVNWSAAAGLELACKCSA